MRNLPLFTILTLAVGCGGGFAPETGRWATSDGAVVSNTCPTDDDDDGSATEDGEVFLFFNEETEAYSLGFTANATADEQIACTLDGRDLTCDPLVFELDLTPDVDLVQTTTQNISVNFGSTTSFDASIVIDQACTGEACPEGLPCSTELSFTGTHG